MDNYNVEREKYREAGWKKLAEAVGGEAGENLVAAMKDLYSVYTPDVIDWFVSLYDVKEGMYYYSASARDNEEREYKGEVYLLRPDIESTCQALGFMETSGMADDFDRDLSKALPKWMQDDIANKIYSLQDPDGYFYNPQWGKNVTLGRRARDLMWSNSILRRFHREKKYESISEHATSKPEEKKFELPKHLQSAENFAKYLEDADIYNKSYPLGNDLTCQCDLIKHAGLIDQGIAFLNEKQLPNGLWHKEENYYAINGVMKITCFYNGAHVLVPHAKEIARTALKVLLCDEDPTGAVDLFNPWFAIGNLVGSLREYGGEGNVIADEIIAEVRENAPEAIRATARKVLVFKKESGSFSYHVKCSSHTSQLAPVAIPDSWEGDVNGYILSATGLIGHVYRGLQLSDYRVPLFARCDLDRYVALLEEKRKNTK